MAGLVHIMPDEWTFGDVGIVMCGTIFILDEHDDITWPRDFDVTDSDDKHASCPQCIALNRCHIIQHPHLGYMSVTVQTKGAYAEWFTDVNKATVFTDAYIATYYLRLAPRGGKIQPV